MSARKHDLRSLASSSRKKRKFPPPPLMTEGIHMPPSPLMTEDMVYEIFLRLPIKSLIRFRSVSKRVQGMIDSPIFMKKKKNYESKKSSSDFVIIIYHNQSDPFYLEFSNGGDDLRSAKAIKFNFPPLLENQACIGICNGLFLFSNCTDNNRLFLSTNHTDNHGIYTLWNPTNGTFRKVNHTHPAAYGCFQRTIFAFDHITDDYKLLSFRQRIHDLCVDGLHVYSMKRDSWTKYIGEFPYCKWRLELKYVCVGGALHWYTSSLYNGVFQSENIVAFDLATETFRLFSMPKLPPSCIKRRQSMEPSGQLYDVGGCLSVCFKRKLSSCVPATSVVMVMNKYGDESSWTPLVTNKKKIISSMLSFPDGRLLCRFRIEKSLWLWNTQDDTWERFDIKGPNTPTTWNCPHHQYDETMYIRNLIRL